MQMCKSIKGGFYEAFGRRLHIERAILNPYAFKNSSPFFVRMATRKRCMDILGFGIDLKRNNVIFYSCSRRPVGSEFRELVLMVVHFNYLDH